MAHPTKDLRILASSDSKLSIDPPLRKLSKSASMGDPTVSSQRPRNPNPISKLKDSYLQAKALSVSAMFDSSKVYDVKSNSKPQPKKVTSVCNEKLRKPCKDLERKKLFDEKKKKKESQEGVDCKGLLLCPMVKDKELKELQERHHFDSLRPTVSLSLRGGRRRKSFGGSQAELGDVFANNGVKVVSVDMPPFMQIHAVDCARKVHDSMEKFTSKTLALSLKREFDGVYGPAWHCIVGTSFGSFVTHSVGGFLYFSMDQKLYILLFKTTVQRAD